MNLTTNMLATVIFGLSSATIVAQDQDLAKAAKANIYRIVEENSVKTDNYTEIRQKLEPLIQQLIENTPEKSSSFGEKVGAWKQLWTDDLDDLRANNFFITADKERTYQVVFENGLFYNLTELKTGIGRFSGFLRGVYKVDGENLDLEFTKIRLKRGNLGQESSLVNLVDRFEKGELPRTFKIPGDDTYPQGPVGAKGYIKTIYIDDDMRIDIGANAADGVDDLFILKRLSQDEMAI